jgi:hypothetical protein
MMMLARCAVAVFIVCHVVKCIDFEVHELFRTLLPHQVYLTGGGDPFPP